MKKRESNWQKAKERYEELKKAGRLDEIESPPADIHKKAGTLAKTMLDCDKDA